MALDLEARFRQVAAQLQPRAVREDQEQPVLGSQVR